MFSFRFCCIGHVDYLLKYIDFRVRLDWVFLENIIAFLILKILMLKPSYKCMWKVFGMSRGVYNNEDARAAHRGESVPHAHLKDKQKT